MLRILGFSFGFLIGKGDLREQYRREAINETLDNMYVEEKMTWSDQPTGCQKVARAVCRLTFLNSKIFTKNDTYLLTLAFRFDYSTREMYIYYCRCRGLVS